MVVARFGPTTGWAGKPITYESGVFTLEGHGPITAADVLKYDAQGQIEWAYDGLREWVASLSSAPPPSAASTAHPIGSGLAQSPPAQKSWARRHLASPRQLLIFAVLIAVLIVATVFANQALRKDAEEQLRGEAVTLPADASSDSSQAVIEGIHSLQIGAQSYAVDHGDRYPSAIRMNAFDMAPYVDMWPTNPYTGAAMDQGAGPGQYSYTVSEDRYSFVLIGYDESGPVITVP